MGIPAKRSESYRSRNRMVVILKYQVRELLQRAPLIGKWLYQLWWAYLRLRATMLDWITDLRAGDIPVANRLTLSPEVISFCTLKEFGINNYRGRVIGGDWDSLEKRFDDLDVYFAFQQVFFQSRRWSDTVFYKRILKRLEAGEVLWGCKNKLDLDRRCAQLEDLFQRIREEGYKSQDELLKDDPSLGREAPEVTVGIGRYGDVMFSASAHRLAMAKLLQIVEIPVQVAVRHPDWISFRKQALGDDISNDGRVSHCIPHPDFEHTSTTRACQNLMNLIQSNMKAVQGQMLDVAAGYGYFCHRFEELGFNCVAFEQSPNHRKVLRNLKRAGNMRFKVVGDITGDLQGLKGKHFDVVLFLDINHPNIGSEEKYQRLKGILSEISMEEMFFRWHSAGNAHTRAGGKKSAAEGMVQRFMDISCLSAFDIIDQGNGQAEIFRLYKAG